MSKITHDDLKRSGTGCFTAVNIWQQWASKCETTSIMTKHFHKSRAVTGIQCVLPTSNDSSSVIYSQCCLLYITLKL